MAIASSDKLVVVKAFAPGNPLPLDAREIYESLAAAQEYAASNATAYAGQTIKVVEGNTVKAYNLVPSSDEDKNFELTSAGGGLASVTQSADTTDKSAKMVFTDGDGNETTVYETGVRKVASSSTGRGVVVTVANTDGTLTDTPIELIKVGTVVAPTYDSETRTITLPQVKTDGSVENLTIALGKDMVVTSGVYNDVTNEIILTLSNDDVVKIPASGLVDIYTGGSTSTINVSVDNTSNVVTADLKISSRSGNLLKVENTSGTTITFDGNTTELPTDDDFGYKFNSSTPSYEDLLGASITAYFSPQSTVGSEELTPVEETFTVTEEMISREVGVLNITHTHNFSSDSGNTTGTGIVSISIIYTSYEDNVDPGMYLDKESGNSYPKSITFTSDSSSSGVYVDEDDFTKTKQLINQTLVNAKSYADSKVSSSSVTFVDFGTTGE